jgi:membrane protein DedA with SNARE-associated domain
MSKTFTLLMATIFGAMVGWGLGYTTGEYIGEHRSCRLVCEDKCRG